MCSIELTSKQQLLADRIELIRAVKLEMQQETDLVKRASNFKSFVRLCRDRHFDAVAGYTETKLGLLYRGHHE